MARRDRRGLVSHFAVRLYVYSADTGTSSGQVPPGSMFIVPRQALAQVTEANPPFFYVVWSTGSEYMKSSSAARSGFTKLHLDSVIYIGWCRGLHPRGP